MNRFLFLTVTCLVISIFSTANAQPGQAVNPFPADGATDVPANVVLHWDAVADAEYYDLYLGPMNPPMSVGALTDTSYAHPFDLEIAETYYWRVDTRNASGTTEGTLWQFTTPDLAPPASNPFPENGATDVATDAVLTWSHSPGTWWYDIQFGAENPPPYVGFQAETTYTPGTMTENTTYYWIVKPSSAGGVTPSELWSFTTTGGGGDLPQCTNPSPADEATDVPLDVTCSWTGSTGATMYRVYFGVTNPPPFTETYTETEFRPDNIQNNVTYYWKVNPANQTQETEGEIWSFTTENGIPPDQVENPTPEHHAENVSVNTTLSWDAADRADHYTINFGTQMNPPQVGTTTETSFDPGELDPETDYYWRINSVNQFGQTMGDVWTFTTETINGSDTNPLLPVSTKLQQPYPNPFNAETTIPFELAASQHVVLSIYDVTGREITNLTDGVLSAGRHSITWNSANNATGLYFVRLTAGNEIYTTKILSLK